MLRRLFIAALALALFLVALYFAIDWDVEVPASCAGKSVCVWTY